MRPSELALVPNDLLSTGLLILIINISNTEHIEKKKRPL